MASPDAKAKALASRDLIQRGHYGSNLVGSATFVGLRALDPLLQYHLLAQGWGASLLSRLGVSTIPLHGHPPTDYPRWASLAKLATAVDAVSLSDLPLSRLIVLGMAVGGSLKHIYWLVWLSNEELIVKSAVAVSVYNAAVNSLASLLLLPVAASSALASPRVPVPATAGLQLSLPTAVGVALYVVGMVLETASEYQRKVFKDAPANKGKICTTGLWNWARHINYGGYTLWRTGYGLAAGGWPAGLAMLAWHAYTFIGSSVPMLNNYMVGKYPTQWVKYKKDVKWVLIPGIY